MNKSDDHATVESAASMALNKGTPPDYGRNAGHTFCYLCSGPAFEESKINWRGHWICPGCYELQKVGLSSGEVVRPKVDSREQMDYILNPTVFKRPEKSSATSASDILEQAASTIEQRGKDYNSPGGERSMKATVEAFNAIRGKDLTAEDGWAFMCILKMVRAHKSPNKADHYIDLSAYGSLLGEEALNHTNK